MHWLCIVAKSHTLCGFPICQPGDHFEKKKKKILVKLTFTSWLVFTVGNGNYHTCQLT